MSRTRRTPDAEARDIRISDDYDLAGPDVDDEIDATDDRGRRWYRLRPKPRRGTDFMGLNSTWWMALGWLVLAIAVVFPFPWWW
jgi:hypothetical protein